MGLPEELPLPEEEPGVDIPVFRQGGVSNNAAPSGASETNHLGDSSRPVSERKQVLVWNSDKKFLGQFELGELDSENYAIQLGGSRFMYVRPMADKLSVWLQSIGSQYYLRIGYTFAEAKQSGWFDQVHKAHGLEIPSEPHPPAGLPAPAAGDGLLAALLADINQGDEDEADGSDESDESDEDDMPPLEDPTNE